MIKYGNFFFIFIFSLKKMHSKFAYKALFQIVCLFKRALKFHLYNFIAQVYMLIIKHLSYFNYNLSPILTRCACNKIHVHEL